MDDILIDEQGNIRFIYSDELATVFEGQPQSTKRASHVEPATYPLNNPTGWVADMRPSGGPVIGQLSPFRTRAEALASEREWLRKHQGL
jgi:hypothetical protein